MGYLKAFTILELLVVVFIVGIVSVALFEIFVVTQRTYTMNLEKIYLLSDLRRILNWIVNDLRQSLAVNISENEPSRSHIRFSKIIGYDPAQPANPYILDNNLTEYFYVPENNTVIRRVLDENMTEISDKKWAFYNITDLTFFVRNLDGSLSELNDTNVVDNNNLVVRIAGERVKKIAGKDYYLNLSLEEGVRIRNR